MTIEDVIKQSCEELTLAKIDNAKLEAEHLVANILGCSWGQTMAQQKNSFPEGKMSQWKELLKRRSRGEPLAYIEGVKNFFKNTFKVNSSVLIPRPETEILVEKSLEKTLASDPKLIVDLGCGSGCIGLSLAKELPNAEVWLVDQSEEAIKVSQENAKELAVGDRVQFVNATIEDEPGDMPELMGRVDLVVGNPPYIALGDSRVDWQVRAFEPHSALFAGPTGLECIHNWMNWSYYYLRSGGWALFEFGVGQSQDIKMIAQDFPFKTMEIVKDYAGHDRIIAMKKE